MSPREELLAETRRRLVGPGLGRPGASGTHEDELIEGRLGLAYMMGMLFPQKQKEDPGLAGDEQEEADDADGDDPLSMATAILPSSMGLTVCLSPGAEAKVTVRGARYEEVAGRAAPDGEGQKGGEASPDASGTKTPVARRGRDQAWQRIPLDDTTAVVGVAGLRSCPALEGFAGLEVLGRQLADGSSLLTISLSNTKTTSHQRAGSDAIFQAGLEVQPLGGQILRYPSAGFVPPTEEERELQVIYGDQRPYAVGHGVSTSWKLEDGRCICVSTEAMPVAHVWRPVFDNLSLDGKSGPEAFEDTSVFDIAPLASGELAGDELCNRLGRLVDFYEKWIGTQGALDVAAGLQVDAGRMVDRCKRSAARMRDGLAVLRGDPVVARCFMLANRAMLMSMAHAARASGRLRKDKLQGPFELGKAETTKIDYAATSARWRPFQLAFFLQVLPSLAEEGLPDRDLVDVIWFATGGGKTEAYLLLSAFELLRRRLCDGDAGGGTGVLNRYTYRFLTSDQFQRTAGVICSLEMLRRQLNAEGDASLGDEEFSIGLFAGESVSPNNLAEANTKLRQLMDSQSPRNDNPFPIESCPCCGTLLVPSSARRTVDDEPDLAYYGFSSSANAFLSRCPEEDCDFHDKLPVSFIDDELYRRPPSFLLGTVDKFAMLPWKQNGGSLLGAKTRNLAPSLVIQDELHLISGPLGTLAGIYEAGFETVMASTGSPLPKVIASTATIRNATVQCRRIYGRPASVFPPPGLRAEDSFFSKLDVGNEARSRLYAGVMAQGLRSTVAASWTIASLMQAVHELGEAGQLTDGELDAYWSLVAYHNSKRELGRIANATRDEIPTRMKVYASNPTVERPSNFEVLELKAHSEVPVPRARQLLARRHSREHPAIDVVPCTNIISVGVDIDRLGLMMVNGQPKLSAEYIQATSRVGRGAVPGVVLTAYSPSKPRDRSHYEAFRDYHERFYSFVEPTSVTPGALPALERALHAALVSAVRHGTSLNANSAAARFDPSSKEVVDVVDLLRKRLLAAYTEEKEGEERQRISGKLDQRVEEWAGWAQSVSGLQYSYAQGQRQPCLLVRYDTRRIDDAGWFTLQSMRHVDKEITLEDQAGGKANNS